MYSGVVMGLEMDDTSLSLPDGLETGFGDGERERERGENGIWGFELEDCINLRTKERECMCVCVVLSSALGGLVLECCFCTYKECGLSGLIVKVGFRDKTFVFMRYSSSGGGLFSLPT